MFAHRIDLEGQGLVSFCTTCFQTVAQADAEEELAEGERKHRCDGPPKLRPLRQPDAIGSGKAAA